VGSKVCGEVVQKETITLPGIENGILECPNLNLVTVLSDRFQITLPYTIRAVC